MSQRFVLACFGTLLVSTFLLTGCEIRAHQVRYVVTGSTANAALSYQNETAATEQIDVRPPWQRSIAVQTGTWVGVTAFNTTANGTVGCRLYVDNMLVREATSVGGFKWASCGTLAGLDQPTPTPQH